MIDFVENKPALLDYVKRNGLSKLWLCPCIVSNGKIGNPPYLTGFECTASTIPENLKNKLVRRVFKEGNTDCIIWENDEDEHFLCLGEGVKQ